MKLSVIIPAFNEERTIRAILERLLQVKLIHETVLELLINASCVVSQRGKVFQIKVIGVAKH